MDAPLHKHRIFNELSESQAKHFELSKNQNQQLRKMATLQRDILNSLQLDLKLIQRYKQKSNPMVNKQTRHSHHENLLGLKVDAPKLSNLNQRNAVLKN